MIDLKKLRSQIDEIDGEILRLFERRMEISEQVADYKIKNGKQVFDKKRECTKLEDLKNRSTNEFNAKGIQELFQQIMSISRKKQYQLLTENGIAAETDFRKVKALDTRSAKIVFQGTVGAYTFAAVNTFFGEDADSYYVGTWKEAMEEIENGHADYAVLPIENSTAGIVSDIYDLLVDYSSSIVGEQIIKIEHVLMGLPEAEIDDIKTVYSHPQGLKQCRKFLEQHPEWELRELLNTAYASKKVKADGDITQAAIASRYAAAQFELKVLADKGFHSDTNATRFIIVSGARIYTANGNKVSICFELPHESGTLYNILAHFIYNDLNMTKIESRPLPERRWEYRFFVDFEGNLDDSAVRNALRGIEQESARLRILGNYESKSV